ncbi:glycosyltransferase [Empedobacter falsenii]
MKVAYILYQRGVISGKSNGIRSQALTWQKLLLAHSIDCILINNWEYYNWEEFDAIHIFGYDIAIGAFIDTLSKKNSNIFISPIIDSQKSYFKYRLATLNGFNKLRLYSSNYSLRKALKNVKGVCARSDHEMGYFLESFSIPKIKVFNIPLSYDVVEPSDITDIILSKDNFCLHISSIYQERKNVIRLIKAAKKFKFKLVLAGSTGSLKDLERINAVINGDQNIKVLGFISEEQKLALYRKAKVFALPSTNEGVGIVAVDASVYGCNIAITNLKGPQEYYPNISNVKIVNPYDIDDIGEKIIDLMNTENNLELFLHMKNNFSKDMLFLKLINMYSNKNGCT